MGSRGGSSTSTGGGAIAAIKSDRMNEMECSWVNPQDLPKVG